MDERVRSQTDKTAILNKKMIYPASFSASSPTEVMILSPQPTVSQVILALSHACTIQEEALQRALLFLG